MRITQAVIAAGGKGERLRPFTEHVPKPMVPILDKPLLEWHVAQYKKYGVREFIFTLGYLSDVVADHFGDGSQFGVSIRYHIETEPLGSFGALRSLAGLEENFYFIYGDVFSLVNYGVMAASYSEKKDAIGMQRIGRLEEKTSSDLVEIDEAGRCVAVHLKPHQREFPDAFSLRGASIMCRDIIFYMPPAGPVDFAKEVLPRLIAGGKNFYGYKCEEYSKGVDTAQKRLEVEGFLSSEHILPWW